MNYRLGPLRLQPDPLDLMRALTAAAPPPGRSPLAAASDVSGLMRRFAQLTRESLQAPDLLAELQANPGPDAWVL
ncbi:MAG: hypothetical protein WAT39_26060, partial [Planctomycetota bacterium]